MGLWKRDAWRRSANEHAQQGASRGFRKGLRGFRVQPQGEEEEGRGVYFTQWWGPSVRWLVERHMVTITPVSPGSILGWREVQVWLRRLAISKVDGGPWNTEQHSFSGVVLYVFQTIWRPYCYCCYRWYRCWNGYWHVQSERYNLSAPIQPTAISNYMFTLHFSYGEKKNFLKATHGLYPHPQTWERAQTQTDTLSSCYGAGISLWNSSMTDGQNPLSPLSHTETLGIQRKVMSVCVLKWSFICPSFFY